MQILKLTLSDGKQSIETVPISLPITEYNAMCVAESGEDGGYLVVCGSGFETGDPEQITVNAVAYSGHFIISSLSPWPP